MNLYNYLIIQPNIIPKEHINLLLNLSKKQKSSATVFSEKEKIEPQSRNTFWCEIPQEIIHNLNQATFSCYETFIKEKYNSKIKNIEPAQLLEYPVGGHYIEHNDCENYENGKWVRVAPRDITILFYLNDDYEGGELELTQLGLKIKPKAGTMIAFPSYKEFSHKVHQVTSGFRYSIVTWIETEERIYDL